MLKPVLLLNALSCAIFGLIFLLFAEGVASFIGSVPSLFILSIGAILLINATLIILAVIQKNPQPTLINFFILGDATWVLITIALLSTGIWITNPIAKICAIAIALTVGLFGVLQWVYRPEKTSHHPV